MSLLIAFFQLWHRFFAEVFQDTGEAHNNWNHNREIQWNVDGISVDFKKIINKCINSWSFINRTYFCSSGKYNKANRLGSANANSAARYASLANFTASSKSFISSDSFAATMFT